MTSPRLVAVLPTVVAALVTAPSSAFASAPEGIPEQVDPSLIGMLPLLAMVGVAFVAAIGITWTLVGRDDDVEEPVTTAPATAGRPADGGPAAVLERRAMRHARTQASDDPILAAMGLEDEAATPAASRSKPWARPADSSAGRSERQARRRRSPR